MAGDLGRSLIWWAAMSAARVFYRLARSGPPLPGGPVLLVANHPNALMDPALIAATAGRPLRFLAKSTLFELPVIGGIVSRSGAIPVYRREDGVEMAKNEAMFTAVEAALARGEAVCVFPEGRSHSTGRLEELRTGAARLALGSALCGVRPALVPVGLDFHRKTRFRSRAVVVFGRPFGYDDLVELACTDLREAVRRLTARIAAEMRRLLVEVDPREGARMVARIDELYSAARGVARTPEARLARRQRIAAGLDQLRAGQPEQYAALARRVRAYDHRLARFGLRDRDLGWTTGPREVVRFVVREFAYGLLLGPVALAAVAVFAVPYWLTGRIGRVAPSPDLRATWQIVGGLFAYGAWMALAALVAASRVGPLVGAATALGLPLLALGGLVALERELAAVRIARAYLATRQTPARALARLHRQQEEIARLLERAAEWLERQSAEDESARRERPT
jgi:glycerol-3-phosphate O-acyltransferase/dihydroxyacetone phosphate acyltransferase